MNGTGIKAKRAGIQLGNKMANSGYGLGLKTSVFNKNTISSTPANSTPINKHDSTLLEQESMVTGTKPQRAERSSGLERRRRKH